MASFGADNEPKTEEELKESFSYIRDELLEVYSKEAVYSKEEAYSKDEVYNKEEVYSKEETYSKEEVYNREETQLICD